MSTCDLPLPARIESLETRAEEAQPEKLNDAPGVELHYWPYKN